VVIWGTNPVHTQVNVMHHAIRARKTRGAKIVAVDIYENATTAQADLPLILKPGTDGALACAVMHMLFRDGWATATISPDAPTTPRVWRRIWRRATRLGGGDHRALGRRDRGLRRAGGRAQAQLFPPRLRLHPPAQRRGRDACGQLHPRGDRRLGA
jgi:hypothetical protein